MRRLGLLGGTFDPPHVGHLILAEFALDSVGLECVKFVPAADPPHKNGSRIPIAHRLPMIELAIQGNDKFSISRADIDRPGPHYTADMLHIVQREHPDAELYFIMGGDSLRDLPKWHRPQDVIAQCKLVVMGRPDAYAAPDMHEAILPGLAERVIMIDSPMLGISSTEIADRLRTGRSARYVVPDSVLRYIKANRLYEDD